MATKKRQRQLTIHFNDDAAYILDQIKQTAKEAFRTPEQQALFLLDVVIPRDARLTVDPCSREDHTAIPSVEVIPETTEL